ncbi:alpha/beta fold hydrolase [Aquibacillus rhizosphaerae]|uniref:Alpha/beta hydrolase n=1 Tax=Aquibacillus rhizosphaerae TaxID=3051431 RepID=A0ABT7L0J7_9BACI|nr:alpha/beta hydrolase [Aquibacillus sp. LR5S19]MDL4839294.1 alpha/beta hydrolase [Aquibacillus sp. LR5S19]
MTKYKTNVGNYQMAYQFYDNPSNEVVVFIHGIPTNSHLWDQIVPYVNKDFKVIAVDMIGYGDSDRAPYYDLTLPKQAAYVISLLAQLGIEKANLVGHDLRGGVVQILSVTNPHRIKSLTIADGVTYSNWPLPKVVSIRYPTAFEFQPSPLFIERMLREGLYHPQLLPPYLLEKFTKQFSGEQGQLALQQASFALDHHQTEDIVPYLPKVTLPVKLMWGQHDRYLPPYWER